MTEEQSKLSDDSILDKSAMEEPLQPTPEEEPIPTEKPPKGAPAKKKWIVIVSIIVAIALVSTALYLVIPSKGLEVWTSPESVDVAKGEVVLIYVYATYKDDNVSIEIEIDSDWIGTELGDLDEEVTEDGINYVTLETDAEGTSTIECEVEYEDTTVTKEIDVTVGPAVLSYVEILPPIDQILANDARTYIAEAYMTDKSLATGATISWALSSTDLGTLSNASGDETVLTSTDQIGATGDLTCTATLSGLTVTNTLEITIVAEASSSMAAKIYDLFDVPYEEYWINRSVTDIVLHDTYPYYEFWLGGGGDNWLYSQFRMNVTARNTSKVNTADNPLYVPILHENPAMRGGNIELDWRGHYLTWEESLAAGYSKAAMDYYDGWFFRWNGTVTMDRTAAKMVLGINEAEYQDFDTWNAAYGNAFGVKWGNFLSSEAGSGGRVDIRFAYEYDWNPMSESYHLEKVGDNIVFYIDDHLSWGAESLWGKWWNESFLTYEYWPENIDFHANIGPLTSDYDLQADWTYGMYPEVTEDGRAIWVWEMQHADTEISPDGSPYTSEVNPWRDEKYLNRLPANAKFNTLVDYDYAPTPWNLENENWTITLEWPDSENIIGYYYNGFTGDPDVDYSSTITGRVIPRWIDPLPNMAPEAVSFDFDNRMISFQGPFDFAEYSENQWAAADLKENWTEMGMMPRGIPYIEFEVVPVGDYAANPVAVINGPNMTIPRSYALPDFMPASTPFELNGTASWTYGSTITNYTWDFGDGKAAYGAEVSHMWSVEGQYIISLTVTDSASRTNTTTHPIDITINLAPVAQIEVFGTLVSNEVLRFEGNTSYDPDGFIINYTWDMDDGTLLYGPIVNHTYAIGGVYYVNLMVLDNSTALPKFANDTVKLEVPYNKSIPFAKFVMPLAAAVDQAVTLDGSYSMDLGGTIASYSWEFDVGAPDTGVTTSKSWSTPGTHTATLTVTDNDANPSNPYTAQIEIYTADPAGIGVDLSRHSLLPSELADLTISVVNGTGNPVLSFTGTVNITCNKTIGVTIPNNYTFDGSEGGVVILSNSVSFANEGDYKITVDNTTLPIPISGTEFATVADRSIEYTIYDIFQHPLDTFWDERSATYNQEDQRYENDPPSVHIYRPGTDPHATELYTIYRLKADARNITEVNMANPTFIPIIPKNSSGTIPEIASAGGNAIYDVYWDYVTQDEWADLIAAGKIDSPATNDEGWWCMLWANLTMDRAAAEWLLGLDDALDAGGVAAWWTTNYYNVTEAWEINWWGEIVGTSSPHHSGRLDIAAGYDGYNYIDEIGITDMAYDLHYESATEIRLEMFRFSWGEDVLLTRQLYWGGDAYGYNYPDGTPMGIIPQEPWYEDFHMTVDIGETASNILVDSAVEYGWRAFKSADPSAPAEQACWKFETTLADYLVTSLPNPVKSELDPYSKPPTNLKSTSWDPGSTAFGDEASYDYVPNVWSMITGESLVVEVPDMLIRGYIPRGMSGGTDSDYYDTLDVIERWGYASLHLFGTSSDEYTIDAASGDLKIVGMFDGTMVPHPDDPTLALLPGPNIEIWIGSPA